MGFSLKKLGSKIFDQANPFDNGRTYQQRTPTSNRSVYQQAAKNVQSVNRNFVQPVIRQADRAQTQLYETPIGRLTGAPSRSTMIESLANKQKSPEVANLIRQKGYEGLLKDAGFGINDSKSTMFRKSVSDIGGTTANFVPVGMTAKAVKGAARPTIKATLSLANKSGLASGASGALATAHDTNDVKKIAQSGAIGYGFGAALPVGGTGIKVAVKNRVPLNQAGGIKINNPLSAKTGLLINNPDGAKYGGLKINNPDGAQVKPIKVTNPMGAKVKEPPIKVKNNTGAPLVGENLSGAAQQSRFSKLKLTKMGEDGFVKVPGGKRDPAPDLSPERKTFINDYANMLEGMDSGNGVSIMPDGTRATSNSPFYRSIYAEKGRPPTKEEWFNEARVQIESGKGAYGASEDYAKLPQAIAKQPKPKVTQKAKQAQPALKVSHKTVDSLPNNTRVPLEVTNKNTAIGEFQQGFVDKDAPIINYLKGIEKQTGQKGLADQFVYDTGLQRRSNAIANAQIQSSKNINKAFKGLVGDEKKSFDSYVAARQELSNAERGLPTSAPVEELQKVVTSLSRHESRFKALNKSYKEWSDKLFKAGIIDEATHKSFNANNDYTHVQRVMDDLARYSGKTGNSMSLGTTISKLKRKGSTRDIQPADATAFKYGQDVQNEIQRNQTASNLIDVLEAQGHAKRVDDTVSKNTLSRFVNGEKQVYEVPRDIKELADNISPYQLGILGRIVSAPQRLLRAGATGLSLPFTAANYVKDQVSSGVFSKDVMATHQPANIMTGLFQSAKDFGVGTDDALWQKFITHLGDTTQYDFIRNVKNSKQLSRELRLGQAGRTANRGLHPIRTLEDLNQVTEKATRFQNFKGTYEKALKEGLSESEATQKATLAAWQNSVDFSRMGHVGQAINLLIPYFNAGIQGTRLLGRRTMDAPAATASKTLGFVGLPLAGVTLYNLENEERKKVYDNISDFEKQNNVIVVLPGAKQHEDGSYTGVIKVPLQPGMSNLVQPIRMSIESFAHGNPQDVAAMSKQFFGAMAGPINTSSVSAFGGSVTPQVVKPFVQQVANKDLFTGKQIVPDYIENATDANGNPVKETDKAYKYTSGTARAIGNATGQSPIRVEKFIKDASAKVGMYSINTVDNALAKAGVIPEEQIGGVSAKEDLYRRFAVAQGKENFKKSAGAKYYDNLKKVTAGLTGNELAAFNSLHPTKKNFKGDTIYTSDKVYDPAARLDIYNRYPKVFEVDKKLDAKNKNRNPLFSLESWQVKKVLEKDNLPPGAKDPELSNLYNQPWYSDYATKRSAYFTAAKAEAEKAGKPFGKSDNPYPETPPNLQKIMDTYSSLPKGSGARSAWIKANPGAWAAMTQQFAKIDNWQNIQRGKRGLDLTEGDTGIAGGYGDNKSFSGGSGGGSGGRGSSSPPDSTISNSVIVKAPKPKVYKVKPGKIAKAKISKPKVTIKKSKV